MHTTTIIRAKVDAADSFGQLVHVDADPARQQLNRAVAGFLAGYSGQTMTAYRIDLTCRKLRRTPIRERRCATTEGEAASTGTPPTSSPPSSPAQAADRTR
jgi:hypothetical protein